MNIKTLIAGVLFVYLVNIGIAQNIVFSESTIKNFKGTVLGNEAEMSITIIHDSLVRGTYTLTKKPIPVSFSGKIKQNKNIQIEEISEHIERSGEFKGTLFDSIFEGKYFDKKKKLKGKFLFTEKKSDISIELSAYSLSGRKKLYDINNSPKCDVFFSFLFPKYFNNEDVLDSVQKIIKQTYFVSLSSPETGQLFESTENNPKTLLMNQANSLFAEYSATYPDSIDSNMFYGPMDWDFYIDMLSITNTKQLLSLEFSVYSYSGGAHGNYGNIYKNIDLRSGKSISLNDLFIEGYSDILEKKITEQIKLNYEIAAANSLESAGFFYETIPVSSNFYLTVSGIGFFYNPYEIAPYVMGTTDVFLTFSQLSDILIKDSLWFYLNKNFK